MRYDDHTQSTHQQYEIDKNNNKAIAIYESKYGHVYWSTIDSSCTKYGKYICYWL